MLPRLAVPLIAAWLVSVVWLGGAAPGPSGLTALVLTFGVGLAALSSSTLLRNGRPAADAAAAVAVALGVALLRFLPLPAVLRGGAATGFAASHVDLEAGFPAAVWLLSFGAFGVLGALAGAQSVRRRHVVPVLAVGCALLVAVGLAHGLLGTQTAWGLIAPRHEPVRPFYPFVNPDHLGTAALLGLPAAFGLAFGGERTPALARAGQVSFAVLLAGLAASMSTAAIGIAGALGLVALWRQGFRRLAVVAGVFGGLVAVLAVGAEASATARLSVWAAAVRAWAESPLLGVGLGGFSVAVEPYRTDRLPVVWGHAHGDLLEWAVETGVVGLVGGAVALGLVRPRGLRRGETPWAIDLGIAAVLLHSLVDFPLHVPLIAGMVGALWGVRRAIYEVRRPIGPRSVRAALTGLGLGLGLAAASSYRTAVCEAALATLASGELHAARTLTDWRWQGPEAQMAEGFAGALSEADVTAMASRWPNRAEVWRSVAAFHAREGHPEVALADLDRAERAGPADWRTFVARARLLAAMDDGPAAAAAYVGAFERGAPWDLVAPGYAAFPVAVWWVDALDALPPHYSWALARAAMAGEPDSALLALDVAERDRPGFYTRTRIEVLLTARRYAAAEAAARRWLDGHPTDADTWVALAQAEGGLGRPIDELAALTAASSLNPGYRPRLIAALGRAGRIDEARASVRTWALAGDVAPETYLAYGEVLASEGDVLGCRRLLDQMRPAPLGDGFTALRARCAAAQ